MNHKTGLMASAGGLPIIKAKANDDPSVSKAAGTVYAGTLDQPLIDLGAYQPLHDVVLVQFKQAPEKSEGGVIVPDSAQRRPEEGVVVAVGPGNVAWSGQMIPVGCKRGDRVRFQPQAFGQAVTFTGVPKEVRLLEMRETDILGVWPAE